METISTRHPRGIQTLFFTEMWERFSYYGMRALLVLFMVDQVQSGGMGLDDRTATAIYGLYTAFVYLMALPGGWISDRLLGAQRSVWYGGMIIAAGHFTLAIPSTTAFFIGLLLVVLGTGMLKPNVSAIVGQLYPEGGARRDSGFTIFYMGINLGAFLGPLVCSYLGEQIDWHYGFAAAGVGMVLGLIQYRIMQPRLGDAGKHPEHGRPEGSQGIDQRWWWVAAGLGVLVLFVALQLTGIIQLDPVPIAQSTSYVIVALAAVYFTAIFLYGELDRVEKKRLLALIVLMITSALFWAGFEQAGSSLNLFAERYTDRDMMQFEIPAGWFQSLNPAFIVIFGPLVAMIWIQLARKNLNPTAPAKFAMGMLLLGAGFLVMVGASTVVAGGEMQKALPWWLVFTYLFHTLGELCLSPVGLSAVTKLSPRRFVGQMMGLWFTATALGNLIAGLFAGLLSSSDVKEVAQIPSMFLKVVIAAGITGVVLLLLVKPLKKLMGKVD